MKRIGLVTIVSLIAVVATAQIKLATLDDLKEVLEYQDDKVVVLNFWATWCRPCVKELPTFDATGQEFKNKGVEMILISLDALSRLETNVNPFLEKRGMMSAIWLLDEPDFNSWLNLVDEGWSGAIPATLVIDGRKKEKRFHEGEMTKEDLIKLINPNS